MPIPGAAPRRFTVVARAANLDTLGPLDDYTRLEVVPRYNAVGSWSLSFPEDSKAAQLLGRGGGVAIYRRAADGTDKLILSGPVRTDPSLTYSKDRKTATLTYAGPCDNTYLAETLVAPDPTTALDNQAVNAYDTRTGAAEDVIKAYVNANLGAGAIASRRIPGLTIAVAASLGRGATVTGRERFTNLLALAQTLAAAGGDLGFRIVQQGASLVFDVYDPADLTALVQFSRESGSIEELSYTAAAATATRALAAGGGQGTARAFVQSVNAQAEADWNMRAETFVDQRDTTDPTELQQSADEALVEGGPTAQLSFTPIDTPQRRYGIDYNLGDKVTVIVRGDITVADVVREVSITDDVSQGLAVKPVVGSFGASDPSTTPAIYGVVRQIGLKLNRLLRGT